MRTSGFIQSRVSDAARAIIGLEWLPCFEDEIKRVLFARGDSAHASEVTHRDEERALRFRHGARRVPRPFHLDGEEATVWRYDTYQVTRPDPEAACLRVPVVDRVDLDHAAFGYEYGDHAITDRILTFRLDTCGVHLMLVAMGRVCHSRSRAGFDRTRQHVL
jgi:hypothetical protein